MAKSFVSPLARALVCSIVVFSLIGTALAADPLQPSAQETSLGAGQRNALPSGRPGAKIWLAESQSLTVIHVGRGASSLAGGAHPLSMIAADVEGHGISGLLVGYSTPGGGVVVWHRGNVDALAPQSQASFRAIAQEKFPSPFLPEARAFTVPIRPDFIAAGNFTGDGRQDLAVAARGGNALYIFAGDGKGNFAAPQLLNLPGGVTTLAAGHLGTAQQFTQLLVGVSGPQQTGTSLLVYSGKSGGLALLGSYSLSDPASSIVFGNLGDSGPDAAFLSGGKVIILHSSSMALETVSVPVSAEALALGSFIHDRTSLSQMALLASDGTIHIVARSGIDSRAFTAAEHKAMFLASARGLPNPVLDPPSSNEGWKVVESLPGTAPYAGGQTPVMFRTRISSNAADDVMVLNGFAHEMVVISHADLPGGAATFVPGAASVRPYAAAPIHALSMHVNVDGRPGVVVLNSGEIAPSVMMPLPDPTFTVNTTADTVDANVADGICADAGGHCSLRAAVMQANADNANDTIMVPAGTYQLTLTGANKETAGETDAYGSLDIFHGVTIIGAVDGSGNPTTIIQAGTTSTNGIDKVFSVNPNGNNTFDSAFSNLIIQFGTNPGSFSGGIVIPHGFGGGFFTELNGAGNTTLTNVVVASNSTVDGDGGGIAANNQVTGGSGVFTLTGGTVENNTVNESSTGNAGSGGGIWVGSGTAAVINGSQVLNNNATQVVGSAGGNGGGIFLKGPSSTVTQSAIHGSTISGNQAAGQGGGIATGQGLLIDNAGGAMAISSNTAAQGGGLFSNLVSDTTTLNKATVTGNTANGSGAISGGGGILSSSSGATSSNLTMQFSRLAGNTSSTVGSNLSSLGAATSAVNATNNWWGTNAVANSVAGTINDANGSVTFDPFIVLNNTANPAQVQPNQSSTLTGDMSQDNHGNGAALSGNLDALNGVPITFNNAVLGTIAEAQPEALNASAQATATFNAGASAGAGSADATVDQQTVTASIAILSPPAATKAFNPSGISPSATSTLSITINNPAANTASLTGVAFNDNFPANLVVASPNGLTNTCGGTATAVAGSGSLSLTDGTIASNSSCTVSVTVTSAFVGTYNNTADAVTSTNGGTGNSPSATLSVAIPPTISKLFLPDTTSVNGTVLLSFTINNPNSDPNTNADLTGIQFSDTLAAGLVVASPNVLSNNCGGTVTADPGSSSVTLVGGSVGAAVPLRPRRGGVRRGTFVPSGASGSCFISLNVQATAAGMLNNTTGPISANESGPGTTSNTATLTVQAGPLVHPPTVAKAFGAASFALNGTTSLTFTITNPNSTTELVNIGLDDNLPAGLVVATSNGLGGSCLDDGAAVTANPGSHSINMAGLNLAGTDSCSYSVTVAGITSGNWFNTTNPISAIYDNGTENFVFITGGSASASVIVMLPPSISKSFNPVLIAPNGVSTLSFTITNPAINPVAELGVAFTDTLPANLFVATPSGATGTCGGGILTAVSGSNSISLVGGTIPASSSCVISVNVTGVVPGAYTNTTGPVSSSNGGTGNTASASLNVKNASFIITKTHPDDFARREFNAPYTITVSDDPTAGPTLGPVTVSDILPDVNNTLIATSISGTGWTCTLANLTCTRSDVLAPGASYPPITILCNVPQNITANVVNSATVSGGGDPNTHTANDPTHIGPPLNIAPKDPNFNGANSAAIPAGGSGSFRFDVESSKNLGTVVFSCSGLPNGAACSFDPAQTDQLSTILTMTITVPGHSASTGPLRPGGTTYALLFPTLSLVGIVLAGRKSWKNWKRMTLGLAGAAMLLILLSCGGSSQRMTPPPPSASYPVTVTASAGTMTSSTSITLNVR